MTKVASRLLFGVLFAAASASPVYGQATRTWVSGVGDDVNPCSRTAPCKTFAGAISKTAVGGEINCLDPGGFGAVTITKSLTIDCHYTEGGALAGGNGITVNDSLSGTPGTAVVVIRGLDIFGVNPPTHGVRFITGAALHIEDCVIRRFNSASSFGVSFQPSGPAQLHITNTTITSNGNGATGGGINIQPTGASGTARVEIDNTNVMNNANFGISVNSTGNTGPSTSVAITRSRLSSTGTGLNVLSPVATTGLTVSLTDSLVFGNSTGIRSDGGTIQVAVSNTTLQANGVALATANGGTIQSFVDNRLIGNAVLSNFNLPNLVKQ
jgi:hypothetical protein